MDGGNVSFTITVSMGGNDAKVEYKGKVVDADSIKFEVSVQGYDQTIELVAKRVH